MLHARKYLYTDSLKGMMTVIFLKKSPTFRRVSELGTENELELDSKLPLLYLFSPIRGVIVSSFTKKSVGEELKMFECKWVIDILMVCV